jgi:hypothetical protein
MITKINEKRQSPSYHDFVESRNFFCTNIVTQPKINNHVSLFFGKDEYFLQNHKFKFLAYKKYTMKTTCRDSKCRQN